MLVSSHWRGAVLCLAMASPLTVAYTGLEASNPRYDPFGIFGRAVDPASAYCTKLIGMTDITTTSTSTLPTRTFFSKTTLPPCISTVSLATTTVTYSSGTVLPRATVTKTITPSAATTMVSGTSVITPTVTSTVVVTVTNSVTTPANVAVAKFRRQLSATTAISTTIPTVTTNVVATSTGYCSISGVPSQFQSDVCLILSSDCSTYIHPRTTVRSTTISPTTTSTITISPRCMTTTLSVTTFTTDVVYTITRANVTRTITGTVSTITSTNFVATITASPSVSMTTSTVTIAPTATTTTTSVTSSSSTTAPSSCPTSYTASDGTLYSIQCNYNYYGGANTINLQQNVASVQNCIEVCETTTGCQNVVFYSSGACYLLSDTSQGGAATDGVTVANKIGASATTASTRSTTTTMTSTTSSTTTTSVFATPACSNNAITQANDGQMYLYQCDTTYVEDGNVLTTISNIPNPATCIEQCENWAGGNCQNTNYYPNGDCHLLWNTVPGSVENDGAQVADKVSGAVCGATYSSQDYAIYRIQCNYSFTSQGNIGQPLSQILNVQDCIEQCESVGSTCQGVNWYPTQECYLLTGISPGSADSGLYSAQKISGSPTLPE